MQGTPFADFGLKWFIDIINKISEWFTTEISNGLLNIEQSFFNTPLPSGSGTSRIFSPPPSGDAPWRSIYDATVGGEVMALALLFLLLCVQGRHFLRIFDVSSAYEERRTKRSAWVGAVGIVSWYFVAVLVLYVVDGVTIALVPDLGALGSALVNLLPTAAGSPIVTLSLATVGGLSMVLLKAIYFLRDILLYVYLYGMPFGFAVAFGNIPVVSRIAKQLCKQFVPLAVLPLPAAILFRGYALLFTGNGAISPAEQFLEFFVVVSLPVLALWVTWKTFRYASPLTARVIQRTTTAAVTAGAVVGAGYVAGPYAASTAARFGAKAGAGHAVTQHAFGGSTSAASANGAAARTNQDNVADDGGLPPYRRSENDPAYY